MGTKSRANWQEVAISAVQKLAGRYPKLTFTTRHKGRRLVIFVSELRRPDPICTGCVELKFWNTFQNHGWPKECNDIYGPGGALAFQAPEPFISIDPVNESKKLGVFVNESTKKHFVKRVEEAILEEAYQAGLLSKCGRKYLHLCDDFPG